MTSLTQNLRLVLRDFQSRPGFNLSVVLILALAIGASLAVFNFISLLGLKGLAAREPHRLVSVWTGDEAPSLDGFGWVSYPDFEYYRDHSQEVFSGVVTWMVNLASLGSDDAPGQWTECWSVSGEYFQLLGIEAVHGRSLGREDDRPGAERVAVLSHALWQSRFGGNPAAVGRTLRLNAHSFTIVGVAPKGFSGNWAARQADLWVTKRNTDVLRSPEVDWLRGSGVRWLGVIARLQPGVSIQQASEALRLQGQQLQKLYPDAKRTRKTRVVAARTAIPSERAQYLPAARVLGWAVGMLLVIACANIAILFLVRAATRRRELATRLAVGASRGQLVVGLLEQSFLLSALGCLGGLAFGSLGSRLIAYYVRAWSHELRYGWNALLFGLVVTVAVPLLFGLAPALAATKVDLNSALKEPRGEDGGRGWSQKLRNALVVGQIALALALALGAGLLQRSVSELRRVDLGFEPASVWMTQINLSQKGFTLSEGRRVFQQFLDLLVASGKVEAASVVRLAPLHGLTRALDVARPEAPELPMSINFNVVGPGYFTTLGIPLLAGRELDRRDDEMAPGVMVVSQALAERVWPGEEAVGRSLIIESQARRGVGARFEVVGVAADSLYESISDSRPEPIIYLSFHQSYQATLDLLLRPLGPPAAVAKILRDELFRLDPDLALGEVSTLEGFVRSSIWEPRMYADVATVFALLALAVALLGVFSILSYSVRRRTHELGLRLVVGARRSDLMRLVLRQGLAMLLAGMALGLLFSFWAIRWIGRLVFGVSLYDPLTFAVVSLVFLAVALLACCLPARRAAMLQPLESIRWEG